MASLLARQREPSPSTSKGKDREQEFDDDGSTPEAPPRRAMHEDLEHNLKRQLASATTAKTAQAPLPTTSTVQTDPMLLNILQLLTAQSLKAQSQSTDSKSSKVPDVKKPDVFNGSSAEDLRQFIRQCKLNFSNDPSLFATDRKKCAYAASYLVGKAADWIAPYLDDIENEDQEFILNSWSEFEKSIFHIFGDPNERENYERKLDQL